MSNTADEASLNPSHSDSEKGTKSKLPPTSRSWLSSCIPSRTTLNSYIPSTRTVIYSTAGAVVLGLSLYAASRYTGFDTLDTVPDFSEISPVKSAVSDLTASCAQSAGSRSTVVSDWLSGAAITLGSGLSTCASAIGTGVSTIAPHGQSAVGSVWSGAQCVGRGVMMVFGPDQYDDDLFERPGRYYSRGGGFLI